MRRFVRDAAAEGEDNGFARGQRRRSGRLFLGIVFEATGGCGGLCPGFAGVRLGRSFCQDGFFGKRFAGSEDQTDDGAGPFNAARRPSVVQEPGRLGLDLDRHELAFEAADEFAVVDGGAIGAIPLGDGPAGHFGPEVGHGDRNCQELPPRR